MLQKKLVLFFVLTLCFYFICMGIFGSNGYMYNKSLKEQLNLLERTAKQLGVDINELVDEKALLSTEEGLRDVAISLGYYVKGDTLHVFEDAALQSAPNDREMRDSIELFKPFSRLICLGISAGVSLLITLLSLIRSGNKGNYNDSGKEQPPSNTDDYYINA